MNNVTSGIPNLDRLMGGGLPVVPDIVVCGRDEDLYQFSQQ